MRRKLKIIDNLKSLWKKAENSYIGTKKFFFLSPSHYGVYHDFVPFFKEYVQGKTLDLGAGRLIWKHLIEKFCLSYFSSDIKIENKELGFVSDGGRISIKDGSFDTVICLQVIEHVKDPKNILKELSRVLKKNGHAIISFPHLSYIHDEPEDYFRFTLYGFKNLCPSDLKIEKVNINGGLICFILIPVFIFLNSIFYKIPLLNKLIFYILSLLSITIFYIDNIFGLKQLYPVNYICCLKKL